jgi:hypothetical protein
VLGYASSGVEEQGAGSSKNSAMTTTTATQRRARVAAAKGTTGESLVPVDVPVLRAPHLVSRAR